MNQKICKYPNCTTILNSYNKEDYCSPHRVKIFYEKEEKIEKERRLKVALYQERMRKKYAKKKERNEKKLPDTATKQT